MHIRQLTWQSNGLGYYRISRSYRAVNARPNPLADHAFPCNLFHGLTFSGDQPPPKAL